MSNIKHRIVNQASGFKFLDAAGAESAVKANITRVVVPGVAILEKDKFLSYVKTAAAAGTNEVSTATITGTASAAGRNSVNLKIEVRSSRQEAEYSRYTKYQGKDFNFSAEVAASADATAIFAELKKAIDARVARFNDLPFTYSIAAGVMTITMKEDHLTVGTLALSISDSDGPHSGATVAKAVTTAAVLAIGKGSQIEENIQYLTGANALAGSIKADERVDLGSTYNELTISQSFTGALEPMPSTFGVSNGAGKFDVALIVNTSLNADSNITLFESLFDGGVGAWNE